MVEYQEKEGHLVKVFCPTGQGGGVDPTCSPGKSSSGMPEVKDGVIGSSEIRNRYDKDNQPSKSRILQMQEKADAIGKMDVYVAVKEAALNKVLQEGHFKTAHETGKSNGYFDADARKNFETKFLGSSPIYGFMSENGQASSVSMSYPDRGSPKLADSASQYGDVRVRLKKSVRERTTFTGGDSWDDNMAAVIHNQSSVKTLASPVDKPSYKSIRSGASDVYYKDVTKDQRGSYFEAQIHNGVKASDIEHVVFYRKPPGKGIQTKLKKNNITWEHRNYAESPSQE